MTEKNLNEIVTEEYASSKRIIDRAVELEGKPKLERLTRQDFYDIAQGIRMDESHMEKAIQERAQFKETYELARQLNLRYENEPIATIDKRIGRELFRILMKARKFKNKEFHPIEIEEILVKRGIHITANQAHLRILRGTSTMHIKELSPSVYSLYPWYQRI